MRRATRVGIPATREKYGDLYRRVRALPLLDARFGSRSLGGRKVGRRTGSRSRLEQAWRERDGTPNP